MYSYTKTQSIVQYTSKRKLTELKQQSQLLSQQYLTVVFPEIHCVPFVGNDLFKIDDVLVIQLAQDFYLAYGRYRETFFLIFKTNFLQRNQFAWCKQQNLWADSPLGNTHKRE